MNRLEGILNALDESHHLWGVLNACGISLSMTKIKQNEVKHDNQFLNILHGLKHQQTEMQQYFVGSQAEGLLMENDNFTSDVDVIIIEKKYEVFENVSEIREFDVSFTGVAVLRQPDYEHPGYSKVRVLQSSTDLQDFLYYDDKKTFLKNTVKEEFVKSYDLSTSLNMHGPAITIETLPGNFISYCQKAGFGTPTGKPISEIQKIDQDFVYCIRGHIWPFEASEWITRKRSFNWPAQKLFDDIIESGYFLAGIGSKESETSEIQWRISFNIAERLIIESFNETQIHCIMCLKVLKNVLLSRIAGKNISSYTIKTVIFWCLEDKPDEFWQPPNLVSCIHFCMSKLKLFVERGVLPNYFIRARNQFITGEFTFQIQTQIVQCIDRFLEDTQTNIKFHLRLYTTNKFYDHKNFLSNIMLGKICLMQTWLHNRVMLVQIDNFKGVSLLDDLYDGYNIENILCRINHVLEKLKTMNYAQHFIKLLHNHSEVLQYILLKNDSEKRRTYLSSRKTSLADSRLHTNLRIATCALDDGRHNDCLNIIRTVTGNPIHYFIKNNNECIKQTLNSTFREFGKMPPSCCSYNINEYYRIIHQDLIHQDPYKIIEEFEQLKARGHILWGYEVFIFAWKECWFDVIFLPAELPVLPKPVALELCIDHSQKNIRFHPLLYGLLLEFLWHIKNNSTIEDRGTVIEKMKNCMSIIPDEKKYIGLNLILFCCALHTDYCSASRYLIQSFQLKPVKQNVAYLYIQYISKLLRMLSFDNDEVINL